MIYSLLMATSLMAPNWNLKCKVAREYITTFNYLKDHKEFAIKDNQIESMARQVAQGCDGAAKRFISVVNTLVKAQLDTSSAIKLGREMAFKSQAATDTFLTIFKASYAADVLDLDLLSSIRNARALSIDLPEVPYWLEKDFLNLSKFCVNDLDLPRPKCAEFVTGIVEKGSRVMMPDGNPIDVGVYHAFKDGFRYFTQNEKGPRIASFEALPILERLLSISPYAVYEFRRLYVFGTERDHNPLTREDAIKFASELSKHVRSQTYAH